ncbi:LuxR family transcriptional regulator [Vibrio ponticus]|uniref:LuxR family transcriptional regulator n=1 Tax=Vibrio ponticus TaxID=265668 RepID=A0A3N3E4S2_9VIBR|nr:LuxR C-terminal-related transcriptional regulator [Vibrio ponticus]ROV61727.1 LuxR family transcriptional regulator [Vibrio ponticus]
MVRKTTKILGLIDTIYEGACDPNQWPNIALTIQKSIGGHSVNLALEDKTNPHFKYIYTNGVAAADVQYYEQNVIGKDTIVEQLEGITPGETFLSQDIWDENALHQQYPYEEFYEPLGYSRFDACVFYNDGNRRGWLSVARSFKDSQFSEEDNQLMKIVAPHLKRAFMINVNLAEAHAHNQMCLDALERLTSGVIFFNVSGQFVHCNKRAEKYLRRVDNMKQNFRIKLPDHKANAKLHTVMAEVLFSDTLPQSGIVPFCDGGTPMIAICLPWRVNEQSFSWLNSTTTCVVFILSTANSLPSVEQLKAMFELSKAESLVLREVMNGRSSRQIADNLALSEATIRFHIKNLLKRFRAHSQIEMLSKCFKALMCSFG